MYSLKHPSLFLLLIFASLANNLFAQTTVSSDELFSMARTAAFEKKDYSRATQLSQRALEISPEYSDIRIFLGRVYTWTDQNDSARLTFQKVLKQNPENEDAASAFADLEYWNKNFARALIVCNNALQFHPQSETLLLKKAKSLTALKQFEEATNVLQSVLTTNSKNESARALFESIKEQSAKNKIGVSYDFVNFDKQFSDPWHIVSVDYSRGTKAGSFAGRINYANRFETNAVQFEADAYPRISKTFYTYLNAGVSDGSGVFPKFRGGFSLYANLPASFEAEAGLRYLSFSNETWIYTASAGKYFKNYWFNFRAYLIPSEGAMSNSYSFTTRYYYHGSDYFGVGLGTGISPDETANNVQLNNLYRLKSYRVSADYRNTINKMNLILASFSVLQQEYQPKVNGMQYLLSVGYQRRF